MGEYYNAFFSMAVGLERLCKLIISFDYQQRQESFPSARELKAFGHDIEKLISKADSISSARGVKSEFNCDDEICRAIIRELGAFSDARRGRYANFSLICGAGGTSNDPIASWSSNVGDRILRRHFRDTVKEKNARSLASGIQGMLGDVALGYHTSEDGSALDTIEKASVRTAENQITQKFGRYYAFRVIRYLADVFRELTHEDGGGVWFGHYEHFNTFLVEDSFGLTRKRWPLN